MRGDEHIERLAQARHHDPHQFLGRHRIGPLEVIRAYLPGAESALVDGPGFPMVRRGNSDVFEWHGEPGTVPGRYRVRWRGDGEHCEFDPYAFTPSICELDRHLFGEGRHRHAQSFLGARCMEIDGVSGVRFSTWAPNAERVSVVGPFNGWDGRRHPLRLHAQSGLWELFVPGVGPGELYKLEVRGRRGERVQAKADPYGRRFEHRPATASIVEPESEFEWHDELWMTSRRSGEWLHAPMSVYELHLGSWRRAPGGEFLNYREIADRLSPYVESLGFTHVELLPITEHPLDASWGYQATGFFAPTSRFGGPDDFRYLVDSLHRRGIGVILDWVPAHFPKDAHGLARFDGTALYEHEDPRRGEHRDWGTLIFNYSRNEVRSFLISSALCWAEAFHVDGLRVDAVASMLYLDYSREPGDWIPNRHGGNENLEAVDFLRELNEVVQSEQPGTLVIAEESTAWPQVTRPSWVGGLGFSMKWNMGWMHDSLGYFELDPVFRKFHHDRLTFGIMYAHTENYVLPFSHDEVVHGKRSLLAKMPGDLWHKLGNLRALYGYLYTYPGKKLLFMGAELADPEEWSESRELAWSLLDAHAHAGVHRLVADLNRLYRTEPALHRLDFDPARGFEWIDCHDFEQSVVSYIRRDDAGGFVVVCLNLTPVTRKDYRIGVPRNGRYDEILNSDARCYGGSNTGNLGGVEARAEEAMGMPWSLDLVLPPLAVIVLRPADNAATEAAA